jgi:hypothetical protein
MEPVQRWFNGLLRDSPESFQNDFVIVFSEEDLITLTGPLGIKTKVQEFIEANSSNNNYDLDETFK